MMPSTRPSTQEARPRRAPGRTGAVEEAKPMSIVPTAKLVVDHLAAGFGKATILRDVQLVVPENSVLAVIGPSGCGKSTFLRCLNRMHELIPGARAKGKLAARRRGPDSRRDVDPVRLRRRVGMVFQRPNPFPTMSIRDNVAAGLRLNGVPGDHDADRGALPPPGGALGRGEGPAPRVGRSRSPAASSSGSASPGRSPSSPRCCSWTSRRAPSIPSPRRRSRT